ncbi:uncharacterized protein BDV14DRAFT_198929 [Aspergillus stella-maris]|uniref:uncharacterized protein n=1 Tax=Aspergillus stella-maris TaxID=1810926 RepID=UPI003CCE11B6
MAAAKTLLDLPLDIHLIVQDFPDLASIYVLRETCTYFRRAFEPLQLEQLLEIEKTHFGIWKHLFACRECLRLLPEHSFDDKMFKKTKSKEGKWAERRFCRS